MRRIIRRIIICILVAILSISNLHQNFLNVYASQNKLSGKTISILGASISTYEGVSNGIAADTSNSTIRNNVKK